MIGLLVAVVLAAAPLPDGFQGATWGMSRKQVKKAVPGFFTAPDKLSLLTRVQVAGADEFATFGFDGDALGYVRVFINGGSRELEIRDLLTEKYGPAQATGDGYEWAGDETRITIEPTAPKSRLSFYLTYSSVKHGPAAFAAQEKLRDEAEESKKAKQLDSL